MYAFHDCILVVIAFLCFYIIPCTVSCVLFSSVAVFVSVSDCLSCMFAFVLITIFIYVVQASEPCAALLSHDISGDGTGSMAATYGSIESFDGNNEEWPQYVERLEHFFEANSITDADKKRAVFLSVVGPVTYKLLRNLLAPAKVGEKSYAECVEALTRHFRPVPSEIVERCKFHSQYIVGRES